MSEFGCLLILSPCLSSNLGQRYLDTYYALTQRGSHKSPEFSYTCRFGISCRLFKEGGKIQPLVTELFYSLFSVKSQKMKANKE